MNSTKYTFSAKQQRKALFWLVLWHMIIIISSNYLVQIPFTIANLHTTWGAFTFPFVFLTTDLTVRIFGAALARKIIFFTMIPALIISYLTGVLFSDGQFNGFAALNTINTVVARIALASLVGYLLGQFMDITVFNRLRQQPQWWIAPAASTILGNAIDTIAFFSTAFYKSADPFLAEHWVEIALMDYAWKLGISTLLFLPAYGVLLKILSDRLTRLSDKNTITLARAPI